MFYNADKQKFSGKNSGNLYSKWLAFWGVELKSDVKMIDIIFPQKTKVC